MEHKWVPSVPARASTTSTFSGPAATHAAHGGNKDNDIPIKHAFVNGICEQQQPLQEDAYSAPIFTSEDEQKEKRQISPDEIRDIEADLRGITDGMDAMSMTAAGTVSSGSQSAAGDQSSGSKNTVQPQRQQLQVQQHSKSWRNDEELQRDLRLLNEELERIPAVHKEAYLMALQRCPDKAFGGWRWQSFLEQREYDAKSTAKNLVEYWKKRLALFGEDRCFLPMTLAGAMQDEVAGMITFGTDIISPVKDAAGRTVIVGTPSRRVRSLYSAKSQCRAFWYDLEVISQDPEARRCGFILMLNGINVQGNDFDPRFASFVFSILDLFPVSWRATHWLNTSILASRVVLPALRFLMGRRLRHRLIVHTGSTSKTMEDMRTYALPPERLPKEFGGEVVVDMKAFVNERYTEEGLAPVLDIQTSVEPSSKRIRRESSPELPGGSDDAATTVDSSRGRPSHAQHREDRREPSSLMSMSDIQMTVEEQMLVGHITGRKGDPRMSIAIILKLRNPEMDKFDILTAAGFKYPSPTSSGKKETETFDEEGVSLRQRKNQLNRRFRKLKPKYDKMVERKRKGRLLQQEQLPVQNTCKRQSSSVSDRTDSQEYNNSQECSSRHGVPNSLALDPHSSDAQGHQVVEASKCDAAMSDASEDSFFERIGELPGLDNI